MVTNKGIPDNDALDSLSTKLFNTANRSLFSVDNKSDIRTSISNQQNEKLLAATTENNPFPFSKCEKCNAKVPSEAQYCSKCGKKT